MKSFLLIIWLSLFSFPLVNAQYYQDCLQILNNGGSHGDGIYTIDPDGAGGMSPFNCFCDMTTDGGGWTHKITTTEAYSIFPSQTTAISGGTVSAEREGTPANGFTITSRGVCWSLNPNPTTSDSYTNDGSGTGTFTSNIGGLTPNRNYHYRAYMTLSNGITIYDNDNIFKTGSFVVTNLNDNIYTPDRGSLRWIIWSLNQWSNPWDVFGITFQDGLSGTIILNDVLPQIRCNIMIEGPGANILEISGNDMLPIFDVKGVDNFHLSGLKLSNGSSLYFGNAAGALTLQNNKFADISDCEFSDNTGTLGGAIYSYNSYLNLQRSTLKSNHSVLSGFVCNEGRGGGIYIERGYCANGGFCSSTNITNCTFFNNSAVYFGGALCCENSYSDVYYSLINCTISNNSASMGGGIMNYFSLLTLRNCIIANNTASYNGSDIYSFGTLWSWNYNIIGTGPSPSEYWNLNSHDIFADPLLNPLADNGGQIETMSPQSGSPAINFLPSDGNGAPETDEIGQTRLGNPDAGAFEFHPSKPTLSTNPVTNLTKNTAQSGGNITNDGSAPIIERGVCWNKVGSPKIVNKHTSNGAGTGSFTSDITGLTRYTTYHVRAYATNIVGTAYGNELTFTTLDYPTVTTNDVSNITTTTATCGGDVTSDGGSEIIERGVCWNKAGSPWIGGHHTTNGSGTGPFTSSLTGLAKGTKYYIRAYAKNSVGTAYGNEVTFTTLGCPSVTTVSASDIQQTTATCGGEVTNDGGFPVSERGICWNLTGSPRKSDCHATNGSGTGSFTGLLTGLKSGITYYYRAYATNSHGTGYGEQLSFKTTRPRLELSTNTIDFGPVLINTTKSITTNGLLKNTGDAELVITNIIITGRDASIFSINDLTLPITIQPGTSSSLKISYTPKSSGSKSAMGLFINSINLDNPMLTLYGGVALAKGSESLEVEDLISDNIEEEVAVRLKQNYPNPFAGLTELQYFVSKKEHATLVLTDLGGRVVANLVDRYVNGGWNTLIVNGSGLTAGVYMLRLESMGKAAIMKIVKAD